MTIEAGALALRISEIGADQVLAKLGQIDAKARALGQATQSVKFNIPNATGVSGQLQQVAMSFTQVEKAASQAAPAVDKHTDAQKRGATASKELASQLGQQLLNYYSLNQLVNAAVRTFDAFNEAADRQANAQRKLGATATFTGASLSEVKGIAAQAQSQFKLSTGDSANLTAAFARLAFMSGNVSQTGKLMTAWMDLAAAQGLTLDQVMTGVNSTIGGQDEGLNRLGLMNPSGIWKKWADALGTTVGKMTDQQKFQAIINELLEQGGKLTGEYGRYLETAQGKQQAFNSSLEQFNAHIGMAGLGARSFAYTLGTALMDALVSADRAMDALALKTSTFWKALFRGASLGEARDAVTQVMSEAALANDPSLEKSMAAMNAKIAADKKAKADAAREAREAAAKERQEVIDRALAIGLGNIPITGLTSTTDPLKGKLGFGVGGTPTVGVDSKGKLKGVKPFGLEDAWDDEFKSLMAKMQDRGGQLKAVATSVATAISGALADGFTSAFKGDEDFFAAFGKSLLSSLGNIMMQIGTSMIAYGAILTPLFGIAGPFGAIVSGAAASLVAGTALVALGAAMGAAGSGGGKGGGGHGITHAPAKQEPNEFSVAFDPDRKLRQRSPAVVPSARSIDSRPMPEGRPMVVIGTINALDPDDARWQRSIATTVNNARDRGLIRKTG